KNLHRKALSLHGPPERSLEMRQEVRAHATGPHQEGQAYLGEQQQNHRRGNPFSVSAYLGHASCSFSKAAYKNSNTFQPRPPEPSEEDGRRISPQDSSKQFQLRSFGHKRRALRVTKLSWATKKWECG